MLGKERREMPGRHFAETFDDGLRLLRCLSRGGGGGVDVDYLPAVGGFAHEEAAAMEWAAGQVQVKRYECEVAELAHD